ncbi:MAG TPA: Npt1/Npt2 family nucleotide transporter, partial [Terriglobia bacterium]|nr:Npt1/Npt2 family nucleotide transporter [Terriglobia bacterium]
MASPRALLKDIAGPCETEGARLLLMAGYLLLIITCYTTTKAVRDSLFIIEIGPSQLPILYMLIALGMAVISAIYPRVLRRFGLYALVGMTSLVSVATLVLFWWVVDNESRTSLYVLYIWVSLFGAITASQAWSLASHVFNAREARRSFAWIGLGGVFGGIVGGSLARVVAPWQGTEALLPICAVLMGVTLVILHRLARSKGFTTEPAEPDRETSDNQETTVFSGVRKSPYLSMLVVLLFVGVIVEAFLDYEFKAIAHGAFESKDRLTSFFGTIASYGGMLALLVQTLITGPLLKRFGVGAAILLLPSALLTGFLLVATSPELWAVSVLKLIDGSLSYSVHRSGTELLFVPIPAKLRAAVKGVVDLLVDRIGRAVGGVLLLLLTTILSVSVPVLSLVAAACLIVWIGVAFAIRGKYVDAFRTALERKVIEPEALEVKTLDYTISGALLHALSSDDDRQVLYALNLLGSGDPSRWRRHLPALLEHPTPAVRSLAIAVLTEWRSFSANVEKCLFDPDLDVRIEAVRHLCEAARHAARTKLREFLAHSDFRVVLAAIHCIAKYRLHDGDLIDEPLIERALNTVGENAVSAKTAAARALAIAQLPRHTEFLERL